MRERGRKGCRTESFDRGLVDAGRKVIADFLLVGRAARGRLPEVIKDAPQKPLVVLVELAVNIPAP